MVINYLMSNELIKEQSNSSITVSPGDVVAVAAAYPIILNPQDLTIGPYGMNESPFANIFGSRVSEIITTFS